MKPTPRDLPILIFEAATSGAYLCANDLAYHVELVRWLKDELNWPDEKLSPDEFAAIRDHPLLQPFRHRDHPNNRLARFIARNVEVPL